MFSSPPLEGCGIFSKGYDKIKPPSYKLTKPYKDDELAENVKNLRFLVLDEADRMIETGHFAELDSILKLTHRSFQYVSCCPSVSSPPR